MDKCQLSERDICTKFITPAIQQAGWQQHQFREEVSLTDGRVMVCGKLAARIRNPEAKGGFSEKNLRHMLRFAEAFPEVQIVSAARRQLSWTHFRTLIYIDDPLKRDFYLQMCQQEGWSTRTLQERLDSQLFERTALSKQPDALLAQELASLRQNGELHPGLVLKDPYVLDFLGLQDRYLEKDLEDAILRELEGFLLELGAGFSFVARQFA